MDFKFYMPVDIRFGESSLISLENEFKEKIVFIITDKILVEKGIASKITSKINAKDIVIFDNVEPNPSTDTVNNAAIICRNCSAEIIIALGGGSAMDTAKCVAVLMNNQGNIEDYQGGKNFSNSPVPLVCIPTTAGTGSEVTNVSVLTDSKSNRKIPFVRNELFSKYACIIPSLTQTMPPHITAETGWDAFSHAFEAYWSKSSNPISDILAIKAMKLILDNIERAYYDGDDYSARYNMAEGSLIAGIAFSQTRTTAMHATSFSLTSDYKLSHGRACAITLLGFLDYCDGYWDDKQNKLILELGLKDIADFKNILKEKLTNTKMPIKLGDVNITCSDINAIAEKGIKNAIIHEIPREIDLEKLKEILINNI